MSLSSRSVVARQKAEEQRRKEEEERTKEVLQEFVATFQESANELGKAFVRGDVFQAGGKADNKSADDDATSTRGVKSDALYRPVSVASKKAMELEKARKLAEEKAKKFLEDASKNRPKKPGRGVDGKRMSNLEAFKEELKRAQEERAERKRLREQLQESGMAKEPLDQIAPSIDNPYMKADYDPTSTNLFIGNINPEVTEDDVRKLFGRYGPLASVKIMWPRNEEDWVRGCLTGFVAYMTRKDAERAMAHLKGEQFLGCELKLSWGKPVAIPFYPVYVPQAMLDMISPPPPSGLPFNAQPRPEDRKAYNWPLPADHELPEDPEQRRLYRKMIKNAVVKVVIPADRSQVCLIHRMIEFVIREGPIFEAMIMSRENSNPAFSFLFENSSVGHVYYRWKLFSILQGDAQFNWRTKKFRMFKDGSIWIPPPVNFFINGMPEELYVENMAAPATGDKCNDDKEEEAEEEQEEGEEQAGDGHEGSKGKRVRQLSAEHLKELDRILEDLTLERKLVGRAMLWCVEHCDAAREIVDVVVESFSDADLPMPRKIARLYLLSDVLANCTAKVQHVSFYRKFIGNRLEEVFRLLHASYRAITGRLRAEQVRQRVNMCFRVWEDMVVYPYDFVTHLQNVFLGLVPEVKTNAKEATDENLDGEPLSGSDADDAELDGIPMSGEATTTAPASVPDHGPSRAGFIKSKWEKVEPDRIEEQAMTSSKWEQLGLNAAEDNESPGGSDEDIDGIPVEDNYDPEACVDTESSETTTQKQQLSDDRRRKLREIEVKVMQYQDQLESGTSSRRRGQSIADQVDHYRQQLLREMEGVIMKGGDGQDSVQRSSNSQDAGNSSSNSRHRSSGGSGTRRQHSSENKSSSSHRRSPERSKRKRSHSRSKSSKHWRRQRSRSSSRRHRSPARR